MKIAYFSVVNMFFKRLFLTFRKSRNFLKQLNMASNASNTVIALLAGAAVGAGLGLLFAPDKGTETRKKIKQKFNDSKDNLSDKLDELVDALKGKISAVEHSFDQSLNQLVEDGKEKTEDIIEILEAKLAALKKEVSKK